MGNLDPKTRTNEEREKLEMLRANIAIAREQVRRGELAETSAGAFLARKRKG